MAKEENPVKKELEKPAVRKDSESDQAEKSELSELKERIERRKIAWKKLLKMKR